MCNATWTPSRDLIDSKDDRHFAIEVDNEGRVWLRFRDGEMGRAPEPGTELKATYRVGGGPSGNVGAESITHLYSGNGPVPGITRVRNPLPAGGGSAPETIEEAKLLAPEAYREIQRAITVEDYAQLSKGPGVQRALATLSRGTEGWRQVTVAIDPLGRAEADPKTLQKVEQRLLPFQRMGHEVRASKAEFVPLLIEIEVRALPGFLRSHVRTALLAALGSLFLPDNLSFGTPVRLSSILAIARGVSGVEDLTVKKFERLDGASAGAIDTGILEIGPRQIARLDDDPEMPENGRLLLHMEGGR
jgi:predicted phage baseplate assembly protein